VRQNQFDHNSCRRSAQRDHQVLRRKVTAMSLAATPKAAESGRLKTPQLSTRPPLSTLQAIRIQYHYARCENADRSF
jgi:hypothetical protein